MQSLTVGNGFKSEVHFRVRDQVQVELTVKYSKVLNVVGSGVEYRSRFGFSLG